MDKSKLHPHSVRGFELALDVSFSEDWQATFNFCSEDARTMTDIVYVVIGSDGECLRVGQTGKTLLERWERVLKNQIPANRGGDRSYRDHEWAFNERWRSEETTRQVQFWIKAAARFKFDYLGEVFEVSARGAEEIYLDRYYQPRLSIALEGR